MTAAADEQAQRITALEAEVERLKDYAVTATAGRQLIGTLAPATARRREGTLARQFHAELTDPLREAGVR